MFHRHPLVLLVLLFAGALPLAAQEPAPATPSRHAVPGHRYLKEYWGRPALYLEHQAWYMLDRADKTLDEHRPSTAVGPEREMALLLVDAVTHEPDPIDNPAVKDFLSRRIRKVLDDLDRPLKGRKTLRIYKLYNCGLLFRTRGTTVAVDLNGRDGRLIPDDLMEEVVGRIDVLFITHNHGDHFDSHVRDFCHRKGVPVYATEETFPDDPRVRHIRCAADRVTEAVLPAGTLSFHALPGHQDHLQNNIWVITLPNGRTVCAAGDQWQDGKEDLAWLRGIHRQLPPIDVLALDCWIHDYNEHVAGFAPKLVISQHENEIGAHGIDHREAYWMTLYKNDRIYRISVPYVLMAWGEWYDYR